MLPFSTLPAFADNPLCRGTHVAAQLTGAGYLTNVQVSHHEFWADGAVEAGGQNHGPAPYDLLLAALASSAAMTLRRCAQRRGWALHHARVLASHCGPAAPDAPDSYLLARIELRLELLGDLDKTQRQHLREAAAGCPVALVLAPGVQLLITLG